MSGTGCAAVVSWNCTLHIKMLEQCRAPFLEHCKRIPFDEERDCDLDFQNRLKSTRRYRVTCLQNYPCLKACSWSLLHWVRWWQYIFSCSFLSPRRGALQSFDVMLGSYTGWREWEPRTKTRDSLSSQRQGQRLGEKTGCSEICCTSLKHRRLFHVTKALNPDLAEKWELKRTAHVHIFCYVCFLIGKDGVGCQKVLINDA